MTRLVENPSTSLIISPSKKLLPHISAWISDALSSYNTAFLQINVESIESVFSHYWAILSSDLSNWDKIIAISNVKKLIGQRVSCFEFSEWIKLALDLVTFLESSTLWYKLLSIHWLNRSDILDFSNPYIFLAWMLHSSSKTVNNAARKNVLRLFFVHLSVVDSTIFKKLLRGIKDIDFVNDDNWLYNASLLRFIALEIVNYSLKIDEPTIKLQEGADLTITYDFRRLFDWFSYETELILSVIEEEDEDVYNEIVKKCFDRALYRKSKESIFPIHLATTRDFQNFLRERIKWVKPTQQRMLMIDVLANNWVATDPSLLLLTSHNHKKTALRKTKWDQDDEISLFTWDDSTPIMDDFDIWINL